jgi:hypothetical protein
MKINVQPNGLMEVEMFVIALLELIIPIPYQVRIFYCYQVICSIFILISLGLGISTLTAAPPPPPASKCIVFILIIKLIRFIICSLA